MRKIKQFVIVRQYSCEYRHFPYATKQLTFFVARGVREVRQLLRKIAPTAVNVKVKLFSETQCNLWIIK